MKALIVATSIVLVTCPAFGEVLHVSSTGPFHTISAAAAVAEPGDTVMVHEGVYRERINPPRGGSSDENRIVYQAADGETVVIKGSEIVKGWKKRENDVWQVTIPNSFFGDFNPFDDLIHGDWFIRKDRDHHTGAVYLNGHWLTEAANKNDVFKKGSDPFSDKSPKRGQSPFGRWFAEVDDRVTTIWAQFEGVDPNEEEVEINVRQSVFYPSEPGRNYISVRGFTLEHAATPWAPPTAEQIGLIGTHWSKGWVIEDNVIRYSVSTCVTLGKYGDEFDNTSANAAVGYVATIERGLADGWSKENIGHHLVRNNQISHCEQAGIVGSLGAIFSTISENRIHDIHVRKLFGGHEMAGIKFHGAVDTLISNNHVYRTHRGIWLDWMSQGTRVTGNLLHDNGPLEDVFVEVNHGPFVIDNNLLLSPVSMQVNSQGCAYAHNLIAGKVVVRTGEGRMTPYLEAHGTKIAGLADNLGGDERFFNNLVVNEGLAGYDPVTLPMFMDGNVYLNAAIPSKHEPDPLVQADVDPGLQLIEKDEGLFLEINQDVARAQEDRSLVTTELLGEAKTPGLPYLNYDGTLLTIDIDYFGQKRNADMLSPGPFSELDRGQQMIKVWPKE